MVSVESIILESKSLRTNSSMQGMYGKENCQTSKPSVWKIDQIAKTLLTLPVPALIKKRFVFWVVGVKVTVEYIYIYIYIERERRC